MGNVSLIETELMERGVLPVMKMYRPSNHSERENECRLEHLSVTRCHIVCLVERIEQLLYRHRTHNLDTCTFRERDYFDRRGKEYGYLARAS